MIFGKNFVVTYENDIPIVAGTIEVSKTFRGGPGTGKLNGKGVPIRITPNGYCYDECISAIQKDIRCGLLEETLFWACEIYDMGGPFRSNLINRLKVIVSEDIGIANSFAVVVVNELLMKTINKKKVLGIAKLLCLSPKNRWCDSIIHATMEPDVKFFPNEHPRLVFNEWRFSKLFKSKEGDGKRLKRFMNNLIKSLELLDEEGACYWVQKIYDIPPNKQDSASRATSKGKSKDPMYAVWEELIRRSSIGPCNFKGDDLIVKGLLKLYDHRKNGRTERLYVVHAILEYCRRNSLRGNRWSFNDCYNNTILTKEEWDIVKKHAKIPMKPKSIDKHTVRGRIRGRNSNDFWNVGALLTNVHKLLSPDPYFKRARALNNAREKEKISPPKRKKKSNITGRKRKTTPCINKNKRRRF